MFDIAVDFQGSVEGLFNLGALDGVLTQNMLGRLEPGEAGGAGYGQVACDLVGQLQVFGTEREREQFVDVVGWVAPQQNQSGTSVSPILSALNSSRVERSYSPAEACREHPG